MNKEKILITDDDDTIRMVISNLLSELDYEVHTARDGAEAFEKIKNEKPSFNLLLTDLSMPEMGGHSLIQQVKDLYQELIIIVISSHSESKIIIDIMKLGVFDYLVKPVNKDELLLKVKRGMEASLLRRDKIVYEKEKTLRLEKQINWINIKELAKADEVINQEQAKQNLFSNLRINLGQGLGFGLLTSITDMILMSPKNKDGHYLVSPNTIELLKINSDYAREVLSYLGSLEKIFESGISLQNLSVKILYKLILEVIDSQKENAAARKLKIVISENTLPENLFTKSNTIYFKEVIIELLINAIKYSRQDTLISILFTRESEKVKITILNKPLRYGNKEPEGIKEEYVNLVFEPFFRIEKSITEESLSLNYGLGLTKVKMILQRMNASIQASNFNDYSENNNSIKVGFTISFRLNPSN